MIFFLVKVNYYDFILVVVVDLGLDVWYNFYYYKFVGVGVWLGRFILF